MIKKYPALIFLAAFCTNAMAGPFQDGQAYGNAAVAPGGTAFSAFGNANSGVSQLNSGTGIVQPNGPTVINMQNNGIAGNASGTGLGSFGTTNVNRCAGYIPGSGGPTQDAECGAVNFASQQVNINAQARSAYGLTANSSMFTNANSAVSGAFGNKSTLIPGMGTTATGGQTCTTTQGAAQSTQQSCYVYAQQTTGGGTVSTWGAGTPVNVTCTGGANLTSTSCTVTPAQTTHSASCLTQTEPPTGSSSVYQVGSQANVTCDSGATVTANQCTINQPQATHNAACYATINTVPTGAEVFYPVNAAANVTCVVGANLGATSCTITPPQASHSASCQVSVPVNKTCNIVYGANVGTTTVQNCVSGNYPIYDGGCAWGGWVPNWASHPQLGYAAVTCTGQYTFNLTAIVRVGPFVGEHQNGYYGRGNPNGTLPLMYGVPGAARIVVNSNKPIAVNVSWDGVSTFWFGGGKSWGACGSASIPIGSKTVPTFGPTTSDGCTPYGG